MKLSPSDVLAQDTGVVAVVGWHNAGKTSYIVELVREGLRRGHRIAVIKHTGGAFEMDRAGTDTDRFAAAGAAVVGIVGPTEMAWREAWEVEPSLEQVLRRLSSQVDWVILEGYKQAAVPKIEVRRPELGRPRIVPDDELLALVSPEPGAPEGPLTVLPTETESVWQALEALREAGRAAGAAGPRN